MWKKLSSRILFTNPRLIVEEDEVELPSGKTTNYLKYGYGGNGVVIICQNERGELLLQEEYSYVPGRKILQFPMGLVEDGESIDNAARRELLEEVGMGASEVKLIGKYYQNHRRSDSMAYVFLGTGLVPSEAKPEDEEDIRVVWVPKAEMKKKILEGEIIDADTLSSLTFLERWMV